MAIELLEPELEQKRQEPIFPDPDKRYEIVDGQVTEMPEMSREAEWIANKLAQAIHLLPDRVGSAYVDTLIRLNLPSNRQRRPEVMFLPYSVWPKTRMPVGSQGWEITPALCVEVISPNDHAEEVMTKVTEYLDAGVQQVWLIYPVTRVAVVHESPTQCRLLRASDSLTGGSIIPGFEVKLSDLIPEQESKPSA